MTAPGIRGRLPGACLVGEYEAPAVLVLAIAMLGLAVSGVLLPAHGAIPPRAYDYSYDGASAAEGGFAEADRSVPSEQEGYAGDDRRAPLALRYDYAANLTRVSARADEDRSAPQTTRTLNLPFRDAGLRSQVDDVVRHFDEFGRPPTGHLRASLRVA